MKIGTNTFVSIDYALTLDSGALVDRSRPGAPLGFVWGASQIIPGLEKALEGMGPGESARVTVEAEEGYGHANPQLIQEIPRDRFPEGQPIEPGMSFQADGPRGAIRFVVKSADDATVVADFNHPLAGERLHFEVTVAEVRAASVEELHAVAEGATGGCCGRSDACGEMGGCGGGDQRTHEGGCGCCGTGGPPASTARP